MADKINLAGFSALGPVELQMFKNALMELEDDKDDDMYSRPGAQLSGKQTFTSEDGKSVTGYPVLVDFRRLLQLSPSNLTAAFTGDCSIIPGISNKDLLHSVIGLYDVSLSEMTPDVLYSTVCEKWARTIVIVRDIKDTIIDMEEHKLCKSGKKEKEPENEIKEDEDGKDKYEEEESTPSKFAGVYSDTESEEEEEDEEDEEEDFSLGINSFIKTAVQRRKQRKSKNKIEESDCGVENRILGCATYEKKYIKHKERVVHLTLVTVRKRFRKYGLGKYLLQQIIDPAIVGQYDAVVVHADNAAVDFFQKYGFSDDIVLNSRWSDLAEQFTNCTLMCYLPGFSGHSLLKTIKIPDFEVFELEQEFNKWKSKTTEVYQNQVSIVMRMKHEIIQLKALVDRQQKLIETLLRDNDRVKKERATIEKEFLDYRLGSTSITHKFSPTLIDRLDDVEDEINTEILINDLQKQVELMDLTVKRKRIESLLETDPMNRSKLTTVDDCKYLSFPPAKQRNANNEPYDHMKDAAFFYDVTERFKKGMKLDPDFKTRNVEVNTISKATLTDRFQEKYRDKIKVLHDPSMVADLYFCSDKMERAQDILKLGFSSSDIVAGSYGKGLYFSKFPSRASQHSKSGKVLLVEVGLGKVETVMKRDGQRQKPGAGFDSILIPGRIVRDTGNGDSTMNEEYVIFEPSQVMPLCLISMTEP